MLTNTFLRALLVVSIGTPGRLSLHRVIVQGVVCAVDRVDSCIYFCIAAVLFPQSGTFFQHTLAAHVISNHETCHVQSEWEEMLCLDVAAAAQRHRRHHQVVERLCCAGALRLHHCGFGCRCQLCLSDTHWLHFSVFVDALYNHEAMTTPSPLPGQAALRGESGCSTRKALPRPRSSAPSTSSSSSCRSLPLRIYHRRCERYTQTGKTHDICIYSFSF